MLRGHFLGDLTWMGSERYRAGALQPECLETEKKECSLVGAFVHGDGTQEKLRECRAKEEMGVATQSLRYSYQRV